MKSIGIIGLAICMVMPSPASSTENRIDRIRPDAPALAPYGQYAVGVRTLKIVNPGQVDVVHIEPDKPFPTYDRPLVLEIWYPAKQAGQGDDYRVFLRDGKTEISVAGRAQRDAKPLKDKGQRFPLIIVSHGYPGNRYLMSPLAENLASKGYVVASIDHTDSTYNDMAAFGSTLVNRPLDQRFALQEIARLSDKPDNFLSGIVDASNVGLIGYSMGGYGAVVTAGAGVSDEAVGADWSAKERALAVHHAGTQEHAELFDDRFKAIISIAPWGMQRGMWDERGLSEVKVPIFFIAGSADDVSDYEKGIRRIFESRMPVDRYLLTFADANHNAAATMPAPVESWKTSETLGFAPFEHYADPVWDTVRMNNIAQHFATAWFDVKLKGDQGKVKYLELSEQSDKGVWAVNKDGTRKSEHSYWEGFANRTAKALRLEHRKPD